MHDLPSNGHFKRDYAIGIPEGYIRGGTARPHTHVVDYFVDLAKVNKYHVEI